MVSLLLVLLLGARAVTRNDGIAIDIFYVEEDKEESLVIKNKKTL